MTAAEVEETLLKTFSTLLKLQKAEEEGELFEAEPANESPTTSKMNPLDSIQHDRIVCLECGAGMKLILPDFVVRPIASGMA